MDITTISAKSIHGQPPGSYTHTNPKTYMHYLDHASNGTKCANSEMAFLGSNNMLGDPIFVESSESRRLVASSENMSFVFSVSFR